MSYIWQISKSLPVPPSTSKPTSSRLWADTPRMRAVLMAATYRTGCRAARGPNTADTVTLFRTNSWHLAHCGTSEPVRGAPPQTNGRTKCSRFSPVILLNSVQFRSAAFQRYTQVNRKHTAALKPSTSRIKSLACSGLKLSLPLGLYWYSSFGSPFPDNLTDCSSHLFRHFSLLLYWCLLLPVPLLHRHSVPTRQSVSWTNTFAPSLFFSLTSDIRMKNRSGCHSSQIFWTPGNYIKQTSKTFSVFGCSQTVWNIFELVNFRRYEVIKTTKSCEVLIC
jgi:hypothetical protein